MHEMRLRRAHAFAADFPERVNITDRTVHVLDIIRNDVDPHSFTQREIQDEYELRTQIPDLEMKRRHPLTVQFAKLLAAGFIERNEDGRWSITTEGELFSAKSPVIPEEEQGDDALKEPRASWREWRDADEG